MEKYSPKFYKYFKDDKKIEYYIYIYIFRHLSNIVSRDKYTFS